MYQFLDGAMATTGNSNSPLIARHTKCQRRSRSCSQPFERGAGGRTINWSESGSGPRTSLMAQKVPDMMPCTREAALVGRLARRWQKLSWGVRFRRGGAAGNDADDVGGRGHQRGERGERRERLYSIFLMTSRGRGSNRR